MVDYKHIDGIFICTNAFQIVFNFFCIFNIWSNLKHKAEDLIISLHQGKTNLKDIFSIKIHVTCGKIVRESVGRINVNLRSETHPGNRFLFSVVVIFLQWLWRENPFSSFSDHIVSGESNHQDNSLQQNTVDVSTPQITLHDTLIYMIHMCTLVKKVA